MRQIPWTALAVAFGSLLACENSTRPDDDRPAEDEIYRIPVVVHVLHEGEPVGTAFNLSASRIERQIEILNEDFRRREGTPGFNEHPVGADARIEFVLARSTPEGEATDGIHRVDITQVENPVPPNQRYDYYAHYGYWDHRHFLNIWTEPLPPEFVDIVLGTATGPNTDLPGAENLVAGEPLQSEGILINSAHFGETELSEDYNLGRTLTHEVGHYLGLLHLWGAGDCENNDYCDDTPPVTQRNISCASQPLACDGSAAFVSNYMDYTPDACMNFFSADQVARMRYVLENSEDRISLHASPGPVGP